MTLAPNLKVTYVKTFGQTPAENVVAELDFVSREVKSRQVHTWDKGLVDQQYVEVRNPDVWRGEVPYPFGPEFMVEDK